MPRPPFRSTCTSAASLHFLPKQFTVKRLAAAVKETLAA
jgi:hypothetical protein